MEEETELLLHLLALLDEALNAFAVVVEAACVREVEVHHNFACEAWSVSLPQIASDLVFLHSYVQWSASGVGWIILHNLAVDLL